LNIFFKSNPPEPKIVTLDQPILAVGLSIRTNIRDVINDLPRINKQYLKLKEKYGIPDIKEPPEVIALRKNIDAFESWDFYTGHAVTKSAAKLPQELIGFEAPAGIYAILPIRCDHKLLFGLTVMKIKKYFYRTWLPHSIYQFGGCEFEYGNEAIRQQNRLALDLYIALKERNK